MNSSWFELRAFDTQSLAIEGSLSVEHLDVIELKFSCFNLARNSRLMKSVVKLAPL